MSRQIKIAVLTADVAIVNGALAGLGGTAVTGTVAEIVPSDISTEDKSALQDQLEDACFKVWKDSLIVCPRYPDMALKAERYNHVLVVGEMRIGFENQIRIPCRCSDDYREPNWTGEIAGIIRYLLATNSATPE